MYFPKSQIKDNLYTNGDSLIITPTQEYYKGFYYETSNGKKFTGKFPGDGENLPLQEIQDLGEEDILPFQSTQITTLIYDITPENTIKETPNSNYIELNNPTPRALPHTHHITLTNQDYQEGKFTRYFTKKINELKYKEISEDTYKKLKNRDEQIAWDLYEPEKIEWEISGNKQIIARNNKQKVIKIEQNRRWYGFSKFLKEDYTKYWKP